MSEAKEIQTATKLMPRGRELPRWKLLMFRLVALLLPLFALEAAARVYWVLFVEPPKSDSRLYEEMLGEKVQGDEVPYQFHVNREFVVAGTPTKTNNLAIRGDYDIELRQPYHGVRILCIGDSVTFGYTVSGNHATYPAVLERLLHDKQVECQVLNAGMPRFRIQHVTTMFHDQFRHFDANVVIVLGGWNNANDRVLKPTGTRSLTAILNDHWYVLKVVRYWDVLPQFGAVEHPPARIDYSGIEEYGTSLERLIQLVRENGAQPVLCTLPHFFHNLSHDDARHKAATFTPVGTLDQLAEVADLMNDQIREVGRNANVPVIELADIADHQQFGDAIHPNDEGSRAIAQRVAADLLSLELVTQASGGRHEQQDSR